MIDSLGHTLLAWLLPVNAWTALLLALALLVDRALARRALASLRILLYVPVALRVLVPLSWSISVGQAPRALTLLTPFVFVPSAVRTVAAPLHVMTWHAVLVVAYVVGAVLLAARVIARRVQLSRMLQSARPVPAAFAPCPVVSHPELGPMVAGLFAPRIVVPEGMLDVAGRPALALVLRHEVAHLRRRDPWLSAAMQLLVVAAWPVLPVWFAAARVRHLLEIACDDMALADADASGRRAYGHALLDVAERRSLLLSGAGELHFGSTLRARIEALGVERRWPRALQACIVGALVALFAACSGSGWKGEAAGAAIAEVPLNDREWSKQCPHFIERFAGWSDPAIRWASGPVDGVPDAEVAACRTPKVLAEVDEAMWMREARNVVGQMAKDLADAWLRDGARGRWAICPSDGPVPRMLPRQGEPYRPTSDDWKGPGFSCMEFAMDQPMHFQYSLESDAHGYVITARGRRRRGDHTVELTVLNRGELAEDPAEPGHKPGVLDMMNLAPNLEESMRDVP
jgi:beta-lactamase regulating signal transducer with metallopeptidase domain